MTEEIRNETFWFQKPKAVAGLGIPAFLYLLTWGFQKAIGESESIDTWVHSGLSPWQRTVIEFLSPMMTIAVLTLPIFFIIYLYALTKLIVAKKNGKLESNRTLTVFAIYMLAGLLMLSNMILYKN